MFNIDESDLGIDYQDSGQWRSYGIESSGETIEELFENATIYEIDQDGGEIDCYSMDDADVEISKIARKYLSDLVSSSIDDILLEEKELYETSNF